MGRAKLQNVLTAYALRNDTVGYCQSLNYVGAMLLVALQFEEEAAFWMLAALVEQVLPDFYSRAMTGILIEQAVFASFVREMAPDVHSHFEELGVPLEMVSTQWFLCLYVNVLPVATLLRVWDAMLWEGPAVLLRCGAALLYCYREAVQSTSDFAEISQLLQRLGHDMWHADRLLSLMFNKAGLPYLRKLKPQQTVALGKVSREREEAQAKKEGEEVRDLAQSTHFDAPEVEAFRAHVRATLELGREASDACVREPHVAALVCAMGHVLYPRERARRRERMLPGALFDMIDRKGDGFVKMRQLLLGLSALCRGDDDEALGYVFDAYDGDGDGLLARAELARLLQRAYARCGGAKRRVEAGSYAKHLVEELAPSVDGAAGGGRLSRPQVSYLLRTEPVLRSWLPLDEAGTPAACEHRARVAATFVAAGAAAAAAAELAAQFLKSPEYSEGEGSPGGERAEAPNGDVDAS